VEGGEGGGGEGGDEERGWTGDFLLLAGTFIVNCIFGGTFPLALGGLNTIEFLLGVATVADADADADAVAVAVDVAVTVGCPCQEAEGHR